ncbi:MAG TPA: ATP-binding protein [Xanthobacteraceae bacterium]|nr:ATP-binding protein [Xanthobacteraceae bacterium]
MAEFLRQWKFASSGFRAGIVIAAAAAVSATFVLTSTLTFIQALAAFGILSLAAVVAGAAAKKTPPANAGEEIPEFSGNSILESVISGLPDAVLALSRQGRILAFNAQAAELAPGLRRGGLGLVAIRIPALADAIRQAGETGQPQRVEFSERVPERWLEAFVIPITSRGSSATGVPDILLVTFHDLTPMRRMEEMRADFVANASHELRTPLAALSGFIDTLQGPARDDTAARERFLQIMQAQATRMGRLIDDLLSLSRIELRAHMRPDTPIDLVPIVRQVADGLQTLARDREVEIQIHAPLTPLTVLGDRDELIRVFENLIENALKYGASGKRVEIDFSREEKDDGQNEAQVAVRDHGPGIAPEHLPRLTERFYRVDVADSRAQGGTGLGLALAKHILNRHRGRLSIASSPGQGAAFTVHLPIASAQNVRG